MFRYSARPIALAAFASTIMLTGCGGAGDEPVLMAKTMSTVRTTTDSGGNETFVRVDAKQASGDELRALAAAGVTPRAVECATLAAPAQDPLAGGHGWTEFALLIDVDLSAVEAAKAAGFQAVEPDHLSRFNQRGACDSLKG